MDFPWYEINTDAAVFSASKFVGVGVVVCDHEGSVLAALSKRMPLPLGPLEAKAKAMHEAISFAKDIGLQDVIFLDKLNHYFKCSKWYIHSTYQHKQRHTRHSSQFASFSKDTGTACQATWK